MMNSNLKRKPETEVVLCAILTENRRKQPKIAGNWSAFRELEAPQTRGASAMPPARRSDSEYAECNYLAAKLAITHHCGIHQTCFYFCVQCVTLCLC